MPGVVVVIERQGADLLAVRPHRQRRRVRAAAQVIVVEAHRQLVLARRAAEHRRRRALAAAAAELPRLAARGGAVADLPIVAVAVHGLGLEPDRLAHRLGIAAAAVTVAVAVAAALGRRRLDRDRYRRRGRAALPVGHRVAEAVGAGVAGLRRVGHRAVGVDRDRAVLRPVGRGHRQRVAVRVGVVGQHLDHRRGVLVQRRRVVRRHRRRVRAGIAAGLAVRAAAVACLDDEDPVLAVGDVEHQFLLDRDLALGGIGPGARVEALDGNRARRHGAGVDDDLAAVAAAVGDQLVFGPVGQKVLDADAADGLVSRNKLPEFLCLEELEKVLDILFPIIIARIIDVEWACIVAPSPECGSETGHEEAASHGDVPGVMSHAFEIMRAKIVCIVIIKLSIDHWLVMIACIQNSRVQISTSLLLEITEGLPIRLGKIRFNGALPTAGRMDCNKAVMRIHVGNALPQVTVCPDIQGFLIFS